MNRNETLKLNINAISSDGTGIAKNTASNGIVFVHGALPGETVKAKITARKKDFSIANTIEIIKSSSGRSEPKCRYYGHCGGCQLQHAAYETQLKLKTEIVRDAMTRIGKFKPEIFENLICEPSPESWGYRNKAAFPVQGFKGKIITGFYRAGTHRLELIKNCPVNAKRLNEIYGKILNGLENNSLPFDGYDEQTGKGKLRHLIARTGINTGESLLSFVINGRLSAKSVKSLTALGNSARPDTLTINHNSKPGNVILGTYTENLIGSGLISERLGKYKLMFDTTSFFQVNTGQAEKLFSFVSGLTAGDKNILELYSGTGSLTCYLAENAEHVTSVEEWRSAVKTASKNLSANGFDNVETLCGRSEDVIADLKDRYDSVVLDPPRDGCDRSVLEAINDFDVKKIIYVSCNPATLARDSRILTSHGYELIKIKSFDMFPQTAHVETVCLLSRK